MEQEELSPELKKLISKVKLKEPSPEMMANYLSEVNAKIDKGVKSLPFGFPQFAVIFAVGLVFAGSHYFFLGHAQKQPVSDTGTVSMQSAAENRRTETVSSVPQPAQAKVVVSSQKPLTLEEEMAILEAFGDESSNESTGTFEDEDPFEELAVLDDVELSSHMSLGPSNV